VVEGRQGVVVVALVCIEHRLPVISTIRGGGDPRRFN
jgi:hypothetical protein